MKETCFWWVKSSSLVSFAALLILAALAHVARVDDGGREIADGAGIAVSSSERDVRDAAVEPGRLDAHRRVQVDLAACRIRNE